VCDGRSKVVTKSCTRNSLRPFWPERTERSPVSVSQGDYGRKSKPIEERPAPPPRCACRHLLFVNRREEPRGIIGTDASAVKELVRLLHEEAKII